MYNIRWDYVGIGIDLHMEILFCASRIQIGSVIVSAYVREFVT